MQGFGDGTKPGTSTQWPSSLSMAATFDPTLALRWGTAMGEEFWGKGTNIQEGPGVNVARVQKNVSFARFCASLLGTYMPRSRAVHRQKVGCP